MAQSCDGAAGLQAAAPPRRLTPAVLDGVVPGGPLEPEVMFRWVCHRVRDPVSWSNASQLAKTVLAAVLAWTLAVDVLHLSQAFMAPWAALLTVQATVFGTLRGGAQQAAASVLGVFIAFGAWRLFGLDVASLGGPYSQV
jgi:hypothetical protein